jgi:EmrB/QacA subfamily drug resistance transporter
MSSLHPEKLISPNAPPTSNKRNLALAFLCVSQLMFILDGSIVAVALPAIGSDLSVSGADLSWAVSGYLIPFGGLLLLAGRLGDLYGSKRLLLVGLTVFTLASALCALAPTLTLLVAARVLQGAGGALASAVILGMIVALFPRSKERGRALAAFSFVGAAGSSVGLVLGGVLTQVLSWEWIFLVNLPIGIVAAIGVIRYVPALQGSGGRTDVLGAFLITLGLATTVYVLLADSSNDYRAGLAVVSILLIVGFLIRQRRAPVPLLPLRILFDRVIGGGNVVLALMVAGLFGFQFLGVVYLQELLGFDPLQAGFAYLPVPLVIAGISLGLTTRLIMRFGQRPVLLSGLILIALGLALLSQLPRDGRYLQDFLPAATVIGVGFGLAFPSIAAVAVGSAKPEDAGLASGLFNTAQQVGGAVGLALLTALATYNSSPNESTMGPSLEGYKLAFAAAAGLVGLAAVIASLVLQPKRNALKN